MSFTHAELIRRFENLIRLGTIEQADQAKTLVRVRPGDLVTDWLPVLQGWERPDLVAFERLSVG